jgi:GT2 family glycosyltransferase
MLRTEFPEVVLIEQSVNVGFAGGNNVGIRWLGFDHPNSTSITLTDDELSSFNPRYVLLLNPDTEIVGDALEQMVHYLDQHLDVAVVGPQLRYGDGTYQSSRRRLPTIGTLFWESTLLEQWWQQNPWARHYRFEDVAPDSVHAVDWLVGAAMMVRVTAIRQAGLLDEQFFMYSEELEWQTRLGRYGKVIFLPNATIMHYEGKSSEQNLARRHINFNRSKLLYAQMRWGRGIAGLLRGFLLATYMLQAGIEAVKWLLGHKRALRQQRLVQYGTILRSGL